MQLIKKKHKSARILYGHFTWYHDFLIEYLPNLNVYGTLGVKETFLKKYSAINKRKPCSFSICFYFYYIGQLSPIVD